MPDYGFDDRAIAWQTVPAIGAQVFVLALDADRGIADVLIRFEADKPGRLHRHVCDFSTFVLQGELRFRHPDGRPKEVRPTGSYVPVPAHGPPHSEGAGTDVAIVLFSFRGSTGDMVLYLDAAGEVEFRLGFAEFQTVMDRQVAEGAMARIGGRPA